MLHGTLHRMFVTGNALGVLSMALIMAGCANTPPAAEAPRTLPTPVTAKALEPATPGEARYGVRYESVRLSGAGLLLDFRYRVLDPSKAAHVVNRKVQPYVEDNLTGHRFQVPHAQKVGTLRHMGGNLQTGRVYSMLFANPGRTIKSGAKVSVVMGDYRLDELTVE